MMNYNSFGSFDNTEFNPFMELRVSFVGDRRDPMAAVEDSFLSRVKRFFLGR